MSSQFPSDLPTAGFARQRDLIGQKPVSPEQAAKNTLLGMGPRRPRAGIKPLIPFSSPTFWRKVKSGDFPAPQKLSAGVTAWAWQDVREWLDSRVGRSS